MAWLLAPHNDDEVSDAYGEICDGARRTDWLKPREGQRHRSPIVGMLLRTTRCGFAG